MSKTKPATKNIRFNIPGVKQVGPYMVGTTYEVEVEEADRLIKDKGAVEVRGKTEAEPMPEYPRRVKKADKPDEKSAQETQAGDSREAGEATKDDSQNTGEEK